MPGEFRGFDPQSKPIDSLRTQFAAANTMLDSKQDLLRPPSLSQEAILTMPIAEIKNKYAKRYAIYVDLVREMKHQKGDEEVEELVTLDESDLEHMRKWLLALNSLDDYIAHHKNPDAKGKTLRGERQVGVFDDIRNFVEGGGMEGYVKLPTGFGKTVLFVELVEATNLRSLVVVPTLTLLDQTAKKFDKFAPGIKYGKVSGESKDLSQQVTIITYDSLMIQLANGTLDPKAYDCLILDEVHTALGEGRTDATKQFDHALKLGFTATPVYEAGEKEVSKLLGTEIHRLDIREAVEDGYLCSFRNSIVRTDADLSKVKVNADGEYNEEQLEKAVNTATRNLAAVKLYMEGFNGETAVVYCVGVKHAKKMAELYNEKGVSAAYVDGTMNPDERRKIFDDYASGKIKVLCNADLLIAGFDEQSASVCINLRPTKSRVVAEQRGGRVLRLNDNDPDKYAYIIDFVDRGTDASDQVLFSQVAGGVKIEQKEKREGGGGGGGPRINIDHIKIDGIEIIIDEEQILEIQRKLKKIERIENYQELKTIVQALIKSTGFFVDRKKSGESYDKLRAMKPGLPSKSTVRSLEGFVSFLDFLGIEEWTYGGIKIFIENFIKKNSVKLEGSFIKIYENIRKSNSQLPSSASVQNMSGFTSWAEIFGFKKENIIKNYENLKAAVQDYIKRTEFKVKLISLEKSYDRLRALNPGWPSITLLRSMSDFKSLEDLLGVEKWTYPKLKIAIQEYIGRTGYVVNTSSLERSYLAMQALNSSWPSAAGVRLMEGYVSLADFLGVK